LDTVSKSSKNSLYAATTGLLKADLPHGREEHSGLPSNYLVPEKLPNICRLF
jgi:hypothetical protein